MKNQRLKPEAPGFQPRVLIYARVSSKEQEREGFSIDAQMKLLRQYDADNSLEILREFQKAECAKKMGRPDFNAMLTLLGDPD